ncbi:MAG TPA: hypothetical protein VNJ07_10440, partial [Chitinophagales bacterium]|nr:hypothetical protein [Chitinophagales bacterium]
NLCTHDGCDTASGCTFPSIDCDDGDSCTTDNCQLGICIRIPKYCSDGNPCTIDVCIGGICVFTPKNCDDGDPCTTDVCVNGVCQNRPLFCSDGNPCTIDFCIGGVCQHQLVNCSDSDACTNDICVNGTCLHPQVYCGDNNPCTSDFCQNGSCQNQPLDCSDGDQCTNDICVNGICQNPPVNCSDGNLCTNDLCTNGVCDHVPVDCEEGDLCTADICVNGTCEHLPLSCTDGNPCTNDFCVGGICFNTQIDCDDGDPCTNDFCQNGNCLHPQINCSDGDACTIDQCVNGNCLNTPVDCDDGNPCTNDACQGGQCFHFPFICSDGDLCTIDVCVGGVCQFNPIDCSDLDLCTDDACNVNNGLCVHRQINCNDLDICTDDVCSAGLCFNTPVVCDDFDPCTTDQCGPNGCFYTPIDCNDFDICTNDACVNGFCQNTPVVCDDLDPCTTDQCGPNGCFYTPIDCNDFDICTNDACVGGFCAHIPVDCDDNDLCTIDGCGLNGCFNTALDCSDNDNCTFDICLNGICSNPVDPNCCAPVTIEEERLPEWCQGATVSLKAVSAGALSYLWSTGETTMSIIASAGGTYSVTVTHTNGCQSSASYTATQLSDLLSAYVILSKKEIRMNRNTVFSGGLGASGLHGKIGLHIVTTVTAPGTFAKADMIDVDGGSVVSTQIHSPAIIPLPPFEFNTHCNEGQSLQIPSNSNVTLTGSLYNGITIGGNSTVVFTQDNIDVENIYAKDNVTIQFTSRCVKLRICKKMQLGKNNSFNPSDNEVIVFVEKDVTIGGGSAVNADIYMLGGKMTVKKAPQNDPNILKGLFIVNFLEAGDYTQWYQNTVCEVNCQPAPVECLPNERRVVSFTLVDADTDTDIGPLNDGDVINLSVTGPISVRANVCHELNIESVKFQLNGVDYKKENIPFYTIAGDNNGNYNPWNIGPGVYTITAIPYSADNATGLAGIPLSITITIIGSAPKLDADELNANEAEKEEVTLNAYPNPFSDRLNIDFTLPEDSRASLEVFNAAGQRLAVLFEGHARSSVLNKTEFKPAAAPDGIIIYRLRTEQGSYIGKAVLVR